MKRFVILAIILLSTRVSADISIVELSPAEFLGKYSRIVAPRDSETFVPLNDPVVSNLFQDLLLSLYRNDETAMVHNGNQLAQRGWKLHLIDIIGVTDRIIGFIEAVEPGHEDYKGFGAVLCRPLLPGCTVYQAVHPKSDLYTRYMVSDVFFMDSNATFAFFAGSHRYANKDHNRNGFNDSDTAHESHNLITVLTEKLCKRHYGGPSLAPWVVQLHGAYDRPTEPDVVASYGLDLLPGNADELIGLNNYVEVEFPETMGVCGWKEPWGGSLEDGVYELCASGNVQGDLLALYDFRDRFLHFEFEYHVRRDYRNKEPPGYDFTMYFFYCLTEMLPEGQADTQVPLLDNIWIIILLAGFTLFLKR